MEEENVNIIKFSEKTREELIEEILRLENENEKLKRKLEEKERLEARRRELKVLRLQAIKKHAKTPGQKPGHAGVTRFKPEHIDRTVEQTLKACPDCHHRLSVSQEVLEHRQEDIVPARVEVTLYKKHRYYCRQCRKVVTAPYAADEVPCGYIGPNALIHMIILKYHHALPGNKIVELMKELMGLTITEGAVAQAMQRLSRWLDVEVEVILEAIRSSPVIHMDETGWKVNGKGHWLWAFVNDRLAYYRIEQSRGSKVPRSVVPADYGGVIVSDFYSAYNRLPGKKQRCLVHLMREMRRCYELGEGEEFRRQYRQLRRILRDGITLGEKRQTVREKRYWRRVAQIKRRLLKWTLLDHGDRHLKRLSDRFLRHWHELMTFLEEPGVAYENNLCERMIRQNVIMRNRSYQNRSEKGAKAHEVLMSLLQTMRLQNRNPIKFLREAFLAHRQGNPAAHLII